MPFCEFEGRISDRFQVTLRPCTTAGICAQMFKLCRLVRQAWASDHGEQRHDDAAGGLWSLTVQVIRILDLLFPMAASA